MLDGPGLLKGRCCGDLFFHEKIRCPLEQGSFNYSFWRDKISANIWKIWGGLPFKMHGLGFGNLMAPVAVMAG